MATKHDEVFLVEGGSAASSVRQVCDRRTQSVFAVQGKLPNANKKSRSVVMRNLQVQRLLGHLTVDDSNECRYGKIILLCDPDIDGQHASYLLASLLRQIRCEWVEKKVVYVAAAPLTSTLDGAQPGKTEHSVVASTHSAVRYHKGIASMDVDLLAQACIRKTTRRLRLLTPA